MFPRLGWKLQQLKAAGGDIPSPFRMKETARVQRTAQVVKASPIQNYEEN